MANTDFKSIDEYLATLPPPAQDVLQTVRRAIRSAAPEAVEGISYQIPVFKFHGPVFFFAAWKEHYSLYPVSDSLIEGFPELAAYKRSKGTIRFPYDRPVPVQLISDMATARVAENLQAAERKAKKK